MKRLKTSQPYSLYQLFFSELESNGKIVIPDLQRDYCWGNDVHLVPSFLRSLISEFRSRPDHDVIMGMIYGYYENTRPNMLLCDGQQRLTTLFLLIGLLNRYTSTSELKNMLMSEYERENDDLEPRLIYDIRESSTYFLSELVCNVFYKPGNLEADLENPDNQLKGWWKRAYELDPSITSMMSAMNHIRSALKQVKDLNAFSLFVINRLKFLYYDMGNRKSGEETFVLINTSGEPLTASENLKPVLLSHYGYQARNVGEVWESIDNWFWRNRDKTKEDTSDAGMNEFLRRVAAIYGCDNPEYYQIFDEGGELFIKSIGDPIGKMKKSHSIVKVLYEDDRFKEQCPLFGLPLSKKLDLKEYFVLIPTIAYALKFSNTLTEADRRSIVKVYRYFENIARYSTISRENDNIRLALDAIRKMPSDDICSLLDVAGEINNTYILPAEENLKLEILRELNETERFAIENTFWHLQNGNNSSDVWEGRISPVINSATRDGKFCPTRFIKYEQVLDHLFGIDRDKLRRVLITLRLDNYPVGNGSAYRCFVDSDKDFRPVIEGNDNKVFGLIEDLAACKNEDEMDALLNHHIDFFPIESDWSEFVHNPYLLEYMNCKNMWYDENRGWQLCKNAYGRPLSTWHAHLLYALGGSFAGRTNLNGCEGFFVEHYANARERDCIVVKNDETHIEIDIYLSRKAYEIIIYHNEGAKLENRLKHLGFSTVDNRLERSDAVGNGQYDYTELRRDITALAMACQNLL